MHDWGNWIVNALPLIQLIVFWVLVMRKMRGDSWGELYEKQAELLEQRIAVLRQTNELLKKLIETR